MLSRFEKLFKNTCLYPFVEAAYSGRFYHDFTHLQQGFGYIDLIAPFLNQNVVRYLEMAWFFHDIYYVPGDPRNEEKSADVFHYFAKTIGLVDVDYVKKLINDTKHDRIPNSLPGKLICDIDLIGFSNTFEDVKWASENIRREFAATPDSVFYAGRIEFLETLLKRPLIYYTQFFEIREDAARKNIKRLIEISKEHSLERGT